MNATKDQAKITGSPNRKPTINDRYRRDENYQIQQNQDQEWNRIQSTMLAAESR